MTLNLSWGEAGFLDSMQRAVNNPRNPRSNQDGLKNNKNHNINGFGVFNVKLVLEVLLYNAN